MPRSETPDIARVIQTLLDNDEPAIRWKTRVHVLGEDPASRRIRELQSEIRKSPRVRAMLARFDARGNLPGASGPYAKWQGAHWVFAALADLGYPPDDAKLQPMRDRVCDAWLAEFFYQEFEATRKAEAYQRDGVPIMHGRYRRCASQQGNALFFLTRLGLSDERAEKFVERLLHWQWPDGGWNCDKDPSADTSSFMETLLPMCGLAVHADATGDRLAHLAADRAAKVFLERRLFKRRSDGRVIHPEFLQLHYPLYWHYDILGGLKAMVVVGRIRDPRCADALDQLETKRLPDGGWPAEKKYYTTATTIKLGADHVDWGGTSKQRMNPWVTVDALAVLRAAGRLET
jgi:hypothetical protein